MSGHTQVPDDLLLFHLDSASIAPPLANTSFTSSPCRFVQLPEVNVVGLKQLQRFLHHPHRPVARALLGLGG